MKLQVETRQVWQDSGSAVFLSRRHTESADDRTCTTTFCDNLCNVVLNEVNSARRTLGRIFQTIYSRQLINVTYPCSGRGVKRFQLSITLIRPRIECPQVAVNIGLLAPADYLFLLCNGKNCNLTIGYYGQGMAQVPENSFYM